jgi:hypothetical protein
VHDEELLRESLSDGSNCQRRLYDLLENPVGQLHRDDLIVLNDARRALRNLLLFGDGLCSSTRPLGAAMLENMTSVVQKVHSRKLALGVEFAQSTDGSTWDAGHWACLRGSVKIFTSVPKQAVMESTQVTLQDHGSGHDPSHPSMFESMTRAQRERRKLEQGSKDYLPDFVWPVYVPPIPPWAGDDSEFDSEDYQELLELAVDEALVGQLHYLRTHLH